MVQLLRTTLLLPSLTSVINSGECKPIIADYLRCLRRVKGTNDQECRLMAKEYLRCRMDQYVMDQAEKSPALACAIIIGPY